MKCKKSIIQKPSVISLQKTPPLRRQTPTRPLNECNNTEFNAAQDGHTETGRMAVCAFPGINDKRGLFLAGGYGAPRKTAGAAQGIDAPGAEAGLYLMGVGAVVAVIGGIMFIWIISRALLAGVAR